ncbi:MAG: NAD(P)H-dependent oxidoreductase [Betaproteobacteria bacterium]
MNVLIVYAHPEPASFNGAMVHTATRALTRAGHAVSVSDLYRMRFDPVSDRRNFTTICDPRYFRQQDGERHASETHGFAPEIRAEIDKLFWCNMLVFQFSMWWFGLPAMLKGWCDRVLVTDRVYGRRRRYEQGTMAGKRALCALTTGGDAAMFGHDGPGDPIDVLLYPVQHGVFHFLGFVPLVPFIVWGAARRTAAERAAELERYAAELADIAHRPVIEYRTGHAAGSDLPLPRARADL